MIGDGSPDDSVQSIVPAVHACCQSAIESHVEGRDDRSDGRPCGAHVYDILK